MKKLFFILMMALTFGMFTSCESYAQTVVYSDIDQYGEYYEYYDEMYNTPIVYIQSVPYYRMWYNNVWNYYLVPRERYCYIHHLTSPIFQPRSFHHGYYGVIGGRPYHGMRYDNHRHEFYGHQNGHIQGNHHSGGMQQHRGNIGQPHNGHSYQRPHTNGGFNGSQQHRGHVGGNTQMRSSSYRGGIGVGGSSRSGGYHGGSSRGAGRR